MLAALKAVEEGQSVNQVARDHGIPKTTLKDRVSGRVTHGTNPGPTPYLSTVEEDELGHFLKSCAEVGYGKTRRDAMGIAESVAVDKGVLKGEKISVGWWRRFLERQPNLTLWLELYHPDSLPADWYPFTEPSVSASLTDHFISIVPEVPNANADPDTSGGDVLHSKGRESVVTVSPDAASVSDDQPSETTDSGKQSGDQLTETPDSRKKSHGQPSETPDSGKSISPISKYLVLPTSSTPTGPKTLPCARLLTSAECLAQLEEKEPQKKLAAEEKEQRKKERDEKRAMREQEQKRKAEERAKKAEERARKAKEMAEKKAKKVAEKTTSKAADKTTRKTAEKTTRKTVEKTNSTPNIGGEAGPSSESSDEPVPKKRCMTNSDIEEDLCCMCFGSYSDDVIEQSGKDWIQCACGRWLHEDCAEDHRVDQSGQDRFCYSCLDLLG